MITVPDRTLRSGELSNELRVSEDPPSLALPDYEIPKAVFDERQQDSLRKADAQRIRAEIHRLKLELESIESLANE